MRVGMGYDVHRLTEDRDLILGGVKIPWEKGLLGHSDADVLIHAIMDALLGAAALGDIGQHFPDTYPAYEGISSVKSSGNVCSHLRNMRCHLRLLGDDHCINIAHTVSLLIKKRELHPRLSAFCTRRNKGPEGELQ